MSRLRKLTEASATNASLTRRGFMAGAGAAAVSFAVMEPGLVRGSAANAKINLGLIGCGGRGTWIAKLFQQHGGYNIVAVADYFQDRIDNAGKELGVPEANRFPGLKGYLKLLEKVDAVAIESPPYFHPEQAAAAVAAGKHVYVAKPIAVDVPGCLSIEESGKKSRANKRVFLIDFQTRADPFYKEALRRVHEEKALGTIAFGEATYHATCPFGRMYDAWRKDPEGSENAPPRLGLGQGPLRRHHHRAEHPHPGRHELDHGSAAAVGGRHGRPQVPAGRDLLRHVQRPLPVPEQRGDHLQLAADGRLRDEPEGIRNRMFGTEGVLETEYGGQVIIRGKGAHFYRGGSSPGIYQEGAVANIKTFHESVTGGKFDNPTVETSVRSNLVTILGRTAAYGNRMVTWDEMLKANEKLDANLKGLKA